MEKILTAAEMRRDDGATVLERGISATELMERAAHAVFELLLQEFDTTLVLFLCGSGNNGGDGFAAARFLAAHGGRARICYLGRLDEGGSPDPAAMSAECARQYALLPPTVPVVAKPELSGVTAVVDALFGIGLSRPLEGAFASAVDAVNAAGLPVLAVDIPSGVNADSGAVMGRAIRATGTLAIAARKRGHLLYPGAQLCGKITVADIGIVTKDTECLLLDRSALADLPPRPPRAHKGSFGRALIVGGEMSGATLLAAKAAYRTGAGLVEILCPGELALVYRIGLPEAIVSCYTAENAEHALESALARADAVAIGMGLGRSDLSRTLLARTLAAPDVPLVADADALNLIGEDVALRTLLAARRAPVAVTPHLAEMSRLTGRPIQEIADNLPQAAADFTRKSGAVTVLKDARTVIADGERLYINPYGNSGMATGGSGDVLSGIITSLAAQGAPTPLAARLGVLCHALAGDAAASVHGNRGMMAGDIIEGLAKILP